MRTVPKVESKHKQLAIILRALAHPVRLKMMLGLCQKECNVNTVWRALGISQPLASQHLKRMQSAGLVKGIRQGQKICYRVHDPRVRALLASLCKIYQAKKPQAKEE